MKFVNLTPHPITVRTVDGSSKTYPVDGPAPRLEVSRISLQSVMDSDDSSPDYDYSHPPFIGFVRSSMGDPVGLPDRQSGIILIVSALVAEHPSLSDRVDLASPGEAIRDESGRIIGCNGLCAGPGLSRNLQLR